jgi:cytochrome c
VSADFSFTLNNAQPRPRGARCTAAEASESCSDDRVGPPPAAPPRGERARAWSEIRLGHQVATRTYELLGGRPGAAVGSRLHCSSCHLDAGGDPDAAWWVDMAVHYPTPEKLQARINACFTRSLNGRDLCEPGKDCNANPHMRGLLAYMGWLSRSFHARQPGKTAARGFPDEQDPEAHKPGDASRGRALFAQRCAYCHNREGQGRYEHGVYFRPALWGPQSFNARAGLGRTATLAAFIRANMPYTSGKSLSWEQARDLAAFIAAQCRPGGPSCP